MIRDMEPSNPDGTLRLFLKGAAEVVASKCDKVLINGRAVPMDEDRKREIQKYND